MALFCDLLDPRHAWGKRYSLITLLNLVFLAKMSGMDSPSAIADWCQAHREELVKRLHLRYGRMPGHRTIRRLFADGIDEETFEQRMRDYTAQQRGEVADSGLRVMDGKKDRGTILPGETQGEATMAAYDPERRRNQTLPRRQSWFGSFSTHFSPPKTLKKPWARSNPLVITHKSNLRKEKDAKKQMTRLRPR